MLHVINNVRLIDARTEAHYRIHTQIDSSQYPQVHDFYEFVLVTSGTLTSDRRETVCSSARESGADTSGGYSY